jgi:hypothetical protein
VPQARASLQEIEVLRTRPQLLRPGTCTSVLCAGPGLHGSVADMLRPGTNVLRAITFLCRAGCIAASAA